MKKKVLFVLLCCAAVAVFWMCSENGGNNPPADGGGPADYDGSVGPDGGTVVLLKFAVYGDSRPPVRDVIPSPSDPLYTTITNIMKGIQSKGAQFVLQVGDYMYCTGDPGSVTCAQTDLQQFLNAEAAGGFSGPVFYLMGNHECHWKDEMLCPNENETPNVDFYKSMLLSRDLKSHSWFDFTVNTSKGTAHFIVGSPSAMPYPPNDAGGYDGAFIGPQADWLKTAAAVSAPYTFYLQHQPQDDDTSTEGTCIGAAPLYDYMLAANPNTTLYLYGHTHYYKRLSTDGKGNPAANQAVVGNGGATVDNCTSQGGTKSGCRTVGGQELCSCNNAFGYAIVQQLPNGNVQVSVYQALGQGNDPLIDQWTVTPQGKSAD